MTNKPKVYTISNFLSLLRLVLSLPFGILLYQNEEKTILLIMIGIALASDFLDGWFARKLNQESELGKILDPLADKIFIGTTVIIMLINGMLPLWFVIAVVFRDLLIIAGGIYARTKIDIVIPSNMVGKLTVTIVAFVLLGIFLGNQMMYDYGLPLAILALALSLTVYTLEMISQLKKYKKI